MPSTASVIRDAAEPLAEAMERLEAIRVKTIELIVQYQWHTVKVQLTGGAAERDDTVWGLLILEFRRAGWGFHARFDNGIDQLRTAMFFDHPSTLTRVG